MFRHLAVRLGSLFGRDRLERELDAELRYHLDMLVIVALIACLMPARRAASVDPMVALRAQ